MASISRVSRYAPSPTGSLHLGNVRTALLAWLQARLSAATFIVRMEDLDIPRVKPGSAEQIIEDLIWLGLDWNNERTPSGDIDYYLQSKRTTRYQQVLLELYQNGLVYPCYCSRKDIREAASAPHGKLPVYPGNCRDKYSTITPQNEPAIDGRRPAWRFRVSNSEISFKDKLVGESRQNLAVEVGDFVVRRSDGLFAYQLAVVVDDIDMAITDVVRGEDLLDSTCRQIIVYQALNAQVPDYWHVPVMKDDNNKRLSKRDGSDSLLRLRERGLTAEQVVGNLAYSCGLLGENRSISCEALLSTLNMTRFISCLTQSGRSSACHQ